MEHGVKWRSVLMSVQLFATRRTGRKPAARTLIQSARAVLALGLLTLGNYAVAVSTLNFGGNIIYDTTGFFPSDLAITGSLSAFQDLSISPDLLTSSVSLFADLLSVSSDAFTTTGTFGTSALTDLVIMDDGGAGGATRVLLTGEVTTMQLAGPNGFNLGSLDGQLAITGGLLAGDFGGAGASTAFNFNLDTVFGANMFDSSFAGKTNGYIEATTVVPIPAAGLLFATGLLGLFGTRWKSLPGAGANATGVAQYWLARFRSEPQVIIQALREAPGSRDGRPAIARHS